MIGTLGESSTFRTTKPSCWKLSTLGLGGVKSFDLFQQQKDIVELLVYKIECTSSLLLKHKGYPPPNEVDGRSCHVSKHHYSNDFHRIAPITIYPFIFPAIPRRYPRVIELGMECPLEWNYKRAISQETQGKITFSVHVPSETMRNKCFDANLWELIIEHIFICYQINWLLYSLKHARLILTTHRQQCPILTRGIYFSSDSPVSRGSQASWVACARYFAQLLARIWSVLESYIRLNRSGVPGLLPPSDIRKEIGRKRTPLDPCTCWRIRFFFKRKPFKVPKMRCLHAQSHHTISKTSTFCCA